MKQFKNYSKKKQILIIAEELKNLFYYLQLKFKGSDVNNKIKVYSTQINEKLKFLKSNLDLLLWQKYFNNENNIKIQLEIINKLYHNFYKTIGQSIKEQNFEIFYDDKNISITKYKEIKKNSIYLILDNLRSPFNVGSIFRISDAFLIKKIFLCGFTPTPKNKKILKSAMNTQNYVDYSIFEYTEECINSLKKDNVTIVGLETIKNSIDYNNYNISKNEETAIVIGNEEFGISNNALNLCDDFISIPMYGFKNSINVANAISIVIAELIKK